MIPLLELNETSVVDHVLFNGTLLRQFPFIQPVSNAWQELNGCKSCQRGEKSVIFRQRLTEMLGHVVAMSASDKDLFKQTVNAKFVRVWVPTTTNGVKRLKREDF